jgi:dipeptidyl aminopeptidase/acylaminoacyl peptidase
MGAMSAFGSPLGGLLQQGSVVVATDYQGLGTPGLARFAIGLAAGRAVLDVARAARRLDTGASGRVGLHGHSEGGHAVLWAAELAGAYAPELQVLGVAASAPGADLAAAMVERLCRLGDTLELRAYQGVGHFAVIKVASADMAGWTGERLAGRPARSTCRR